jgi:predicted RNase H-like HicB family nuclease
MTLYTARAERVDGWWAITVAGFPGAHTQVRRLDQAEAATKDLISLLMDAEPGSFDVRVDPDIEVPARAAMDELDQAKANYDKAQESFAIKRREAALALTEQMTVRDAGYLLELSHQRVAQLTGKRDRSS